MQKLKRLSFDRAFRQGGREGIFGADICVRQCFKNKATSKDTFCHCEERSDEAISVLRLKVEIASLRSLRSQ
jgi:hypothetical protein